LLKVLPMMMDRDLLGTLMLAAVFVPYTIDVLEQVRLQARFLAALPSSVRAALPPHPRNPWLAMGASTRFFVALWRCARQEGPDDSDPVRAMKREIRSSVRREIVYLASGAVLVTALLASGWRPVWP
jgi:hypothetical protein